MVDVGLIKTGHRAAAYDTAGYVKWFHGVAQDVRPQRRMWPCLDDLPAHPQNVPPAARVDASPRASRQLVEERARGVHGDVLGQREQVPVA